MKTRFKNTCIVGVLRRPRTGRKSGAVVFALALAMSSVPAQLELDTDFSFGGSGTDAMLDATKTVDGMTVMVGQSNSLPGGTKTAPHYGDIDAWVVKLDGSDNQLWDVALGGSALETPYRLIPTPDGGTLVVGSSSSGISGNKTTPSFGALDAWIVKLDSAGVIEWQQSYGGNLDDAFFDAVPTADGGFVLCGISASDPGTGNKSAPKYGFEDAWIAKIDALGVLLWDQSYGGNHYDGVTCIHSTSDGGFIAAGDSSSAPSGTKTAPAYAAPGYDYWVIKVDHLGNKIWDKSYGGIVADNLTACVSTPNDGLLLGGRSDSPAGSGNKTAIHHGSWDYWIVHIDATGNVIRDESYGGGGDDRLFGLAATSDCAGYVLSGISYSSPSGTKGLPGFGHSDSWIVRIDQNLDFTDELVVGGTEADSTAPVVLYSDRTYRLFGTSWSPPSGNKVSPAYGLQDYWMVRLTPDPTIAELLGTINTLEEAMGEPLYPTDDAYVRAGVHSGTNFGSDTELIVKKSSSYPDYHRETYLKFDLSSYIPADIVSAKLVLWAEHRENAADRQRLKRVSDDTWTELGITYSNRPSGVGEERSMWQVDDDDYIEADLTHMVRSETDQVLSLVIFTNWSRFTRYSSKEHADGMLRPRLMIVTDTP